MNPDKGSQACLVPYRKIEVVLDDDVVFLHHSVGDCDG